MKYRYFSTQRPVAPGTFPNKPGCEINNYSSMVYIDGTGFYAWGHIDYNEPLSNDEVQKYELTPAKVKINVEYSLENEQVVRLYNLLLNWREYVGNEYTKPFTNYTMEKMFEVAMLSGSYHTINDHLKLLEDEL